jgi:hypothetical protein
MTRFMKKGDGLYKFKWYLHGDKFALLNALQDAGLISEEEANDPPAGLIYALYEVELDCYVDLETGEVTIEKAY